MRQIVAVLLLCGIAAAEDPPDRYRHAYDVGFLTKEVVDFPGRDISRTYDPGLIGTSSGGNSRGGVTGDFLASAIVTNFDADSWSDSRNSIAFRDGVLYVTHTKEVHARIAEYLEMLRKRFSRRIVVDAEVILVSPAALEASGAGPGILTPEQAKALRDASADPARGSFLSTLRTVAMNGQRVHAADLRSVSYVRDYDIEIAQNAVVADPIGGNDQTGAMLDVRPLLYPDGSGVLLETRFTYLRPADMRTLDPGHPPLGTIQLPKSDVTTSRATIACPIGRTALLCAGSSPVSEKGWVVVVLAKPSLAGDAGADGTQSTEKRQMRMFDASIICATVPDFPGPSFELSSGESGMEPSTTFSPPMDAGLGLDIETLIRMVKDNVAADSWQNSRNQIFAMESNIVVVQTSDVLDEIGKFLAQAAPARARLISVEAVVVSLDEAAWATRRAALSGAAVPEAAIKELLEFASKGETARVAALARGVGMNQQRFFCWTGAQSAFVQDYDVEIAQGASCGDPVIGVLSQGFVLDVRGTLAGDGKRIQLQLRPGFVTAQEPVTWDPKAAGIGKIQKPRLQTFAVRSEPLVQENTWALTGVSSRTDAGGRRDVLVMLVRARSMEAK